eukprot:gene50284-biopygen79021
MGSHRNHTDDAAHVIAFPHMLRSAAQPQRTLCRISCRGLGWTGKGIHQGTMRRLMQVFPWMHPRGLQYGCRPVAIRPVYRVQLVQLHDRRTRVYVGCVLYGSPDAHTVPPSRSLPPVLRSAAQS